MAVYTTGKIKQPSRVVYAYLGQMHHSRTREPVFWGCILFSHFIGVNQMVSIKTNLTIIPFCQLFFMHLFKSYFPTKKLKTMYPTVKT